MSAEEQVCQRGSCGARSVGDGSVSTTLISLITPPLSEQGKGQADAPTYRDGPL
jgi:hypothetical protein